MKKTLGEILGRKSITEERNWVIVNDNKIIEYYKSFQDAVKDKRGHLMTELYYRTNYVNQPRY
jgi:hypothetical protein